jgi:hypothetical protein
MKRILAGAALATFALGGSALGSLDKEKPDILLASVERATITAVKGTLRAEHNVKSADLDGREAVIDVDSRP